MLAVATIRTGPLSSALAIDHPVNLESKAVVLWDWDLRCSFFAVNSGLARELLAQAVTTCSRAVAHRCSRSL